MNRILCNFHLVFYKEISHYRLKSKCYRDADILSITLFAQENFICMIMCVFHYAL